ncbi:phosphomannomutase/phosphoglucomutase [Arachnia propionica]|uniref:Phosphomannomutase/phosphoglucomutase n=1 Tax=Arachnia propionica TaxID=1750 RepID=A0A3P1T3V9_9ACTN|nr:phosphomannomutase/phosphoglucomutase [Arachnia propionica]RRD04049.1 phosphomannomutase/phosphoglucomutase [Arachnia propionica]
MLADEIFKANDIRGVVLGRSPEWDLAGARRLGAAFVAELGLEGRGIVMGRDMRHLGDELSEAFADGARRGGADIVDVGLTSTDQLWFASGHLGMHGVQFTASHNPAAYNGIKFCLPGAAPVPASFTADLRERARDVEIGEQVRGGHESRDLTWEYVSFLEALVPVGPGGTLKVVVDAGNGMGGLVAPAVLAGRDVDLVGLYLEPDGTFPNHPANPLEPENLVDAQAAVREHGADLALVFDGDADRCFIIDEQGQVVDPSVVTAMIALAELGREPGGTIIINAITSQAVTDAVGDRGAVVRSRVGHTHVKALMAGHRAIFGGEHSAHYYFRDFWGADTGMLAALHVLELVRSEGQPLSRLAARFDGYHRSGEINSTVIDHAAMMARVREAFAGRGEAETFDGLTVADPAAGWWLNLRPSNTEPLLRLNVEARDAATMAALRDEVLQIVRSEQGEQS